MIDFSVLKRKKREKYQNPKKQITLKFREQCAHDYKNMKSRKGKRKRNSELINKKELKTNLEKIASSSVQDK